MSLRDADARHLAALAAVAAEGSFGRAAQRLGFSQSAVSQQIATLERMAGTALFDRPGGPRRVALTPAGRVLLEHASVILQRLGTAEDDLARLLAGASGRVVVGTFQSVSVNILPAIIGRMRQAHPGVEIRLHESDENADLMSRLLAGELDLTFVVGPVDDQRVVTQEMLTDPFVAVAPRSAGVAAGPIALCDVLSQPLIGETASSCQSMIELGLRNGGVEPRYAFRTNDNAAIQAMVRTGMGYAVRPLLAVDVEDPHVSVHPIAPPIAPRVIVAATVAGRTLLPAAGSVLAFAHDVCNAIVTERDRAVGAFV